jgi:uncharacterized delta-60 repeat protein
MALCAACGGGGDGDSGGGGNGIPPPAASGIGPAGGTVSEPSGAKVVIPAGALTSNTPIAVTQTSAGAPPLPAGVTLFGPIYAFTPHGTTFAAPVTITVPFDPAKVPGGTTVALYKTNATQTGWDVVSGATVNGGTMVGNVSGFSFTGVGTAPLTQIVPLKKSWLVAGFSKHGLPVGLEPKQEELKKGETLKEAQCTGCDLNSAEHVGDPQIVAAPDVSKRDDFSYWLFSDETGEHFGSMSVAPHVNNPGPKSVVGLFNKLTQTYTFKVDESTPTLDFLITIMKQEGFDSSGVGPSKQSCPELPANPTAAQLAICQQFMSGSEATLTIKASTFKGEFFSAAGTVTINGLRGNWKRDIWMREGAEHRLFKSSDFDFSDDVDGDGGSHVHNKLIGSKKVSIPIQELIPDDVFQVEITMETRAVNNLQSESYIATFFRDPLQNVDVAAPGLGFESTGLTQIPARDDISTTPPPLSCAGGIDPAAGVVQFKSATFSAPERADRAEVVVERTGGATGPLSVRVATRDASAKAGDDYDAVSAEVRFGDGEDGQVLIEVPLLQDDVEEDDKTVDLALSDVGGCGALGARSTATLTILDDDHPVPPPDTHTVGGTVTGLVGSGLILKDAFTGASVAAGNGPFTLPDARVDGTHYDVRVDTQPTNPIQQCTVANGNGVISGADISSVQVNCVGLVPSGSLDPSFGSGGRVLTTIPFFTSVFDPRMGMALQSDGRILLVGGLTLARFNSDGSPDNTFSGDGQATVPFNGGAFDGAMDVAVQADGKIVVVGVTDPGGQVGKDDFALARFNADGTLDTNFGSGGKTSTDIAGSTDIARRVRIQSDGKILVTGSAIRVASPTVSVTDFALARYNADGTPDTTFSLDGKLTDSPGRSFSVARGLAIQSDGKIVLAGRTADDGVADPDVGLVRYVGDGGVHLPGTRDETFGPIGNGTVDSDLHLATGFEEGRDVAVAADGTLMVAASLRVGAAVGGPDFGFSLASFDSAGNQQGGALITKFSNKSDIANSMTLQADGKVVVVGQSANLDSNADMAVARYNASGLALDTSFDADGKLTVDFFGGRDSAQAVVQQPDGKLVIGGFAQGANGLFFALARLAP